ncbi:MAG: hypothetical protein H0W77_00925 [Acidobacteria bacterium]|nr:hypothetical protein [Acidobacteriota bacterium]
MSENPSRYQPVRDDQLKKSSEKFRPSENPFRLNKQERVEQKVSPQNGRVFPNKPNKFLKE